MNVYREYVLLLSTYQQALMYVVSRHPIYGGNLFSSYKTALIQIKRFHPMFARVPRESDGSMSNEERLVLEVDEFMPMGSFGANVWQSPTYIEATEEMELWVRGMRAGAGGGCVANLFSLKLC